MTTSTLSPMMQQWQDLKNKQKEALLLFRLGDFYEAFHDDAVILSDVLDITLTKRQDVPMSGIPYHSFASYVDKLLEKGFKIAIAEQVENPKEVKGLVKRDIVKILSPGASLGSGYQEEKKHHFIALCVYKKGLFALAWLDIMLTELHFQTIDNPSDVLNLISLIGPKELLIQKEAFDILEPKKQDLSSSILFSEVFDLSKTHLDVLENLIKSHFQIHHLPSAGLSHDIQILACGKLIDILKHERLYDLKNILKLTFSSHKDYMMIDKSTMGHLELFDKKEGKYAHLTLFNYLNQTQTHAGSRLFESWLKFPLIDPEKIIKRQKGVHFLTHFEKASSIMQALKGIKDIQKILTKLKQNQAGPCDVKQLQRSLEACDLLKNYQDPLMPSILKEAFDAINPHHEIIALIDKAILDDPAVRINEGPTFKRQFNLELDEFLNLTESQDLWLKSYENQLKDQTGIKTLKVGSSKNFGFYIEISKAQAVNAPKEFIRRQTLTNQERFITDELSQLEKKSLLAQAQLAELELALFEKLKLEIIAHTESLIKTAEAIALIDVIRSLSHLGSKPGYCLPTFSKDNKLIIKQGRHPIIEELIGTQNFISNDLMLDRMPAALMLITGPNMGGKSTYMRQACLCTIMAQIGSYVPAEAMELSTVDKLFTRIGASDDLTQGSSTFMVEMSEAAYILNNATEKSLVVLDEIGRGTSTYDGIAIAYAIAKFLTKNKQNVPKTLFATHYFELTEMSHEDPQIVNYHVRAQEQKGQLLFLHKLHKGPADKSYGIGVAKLAGIPNECIKIAQNKLRTLLEPSFELFRPHMTWEEPEPVQQSHPLETELKDLCIDELTPLQALNILSLWKKQYSI